MTPLKRSTGEAFSRKGKIVPDLYCIYMQRFLNLILYILLEKKKEHFQTGLERMVYFIIVSCLEFLS